MALQLLQTIVANRYSDQCRYMDPNPTVLQESFREGYQFGKMFSNGLPPAVLRLKKKSRIDILLSKSMGILRNVPGCLSHYRILLVTIDSQTVVAELRILVQTAIKVSP